MACIVYNMTYESNWLLIVNKTSTTTTYNFPLVNMFEFLLHFKNIEAETRWQTVYR